MYCGAFLPCRYLQGRSGRHASVHDLRANPQAAAASGARGVEQSHRRNSTLMRWMFANYERLEQDPRNPEAQVLLAQADRQVAADRSSAASGLRRAPQRPYGRASAVRDPPQVKQLAPRRPSRVEDPVAAAQLEWLEVRGCEEAEGSEAVDEYEDATASEQHVDSGSEAERGPVVVGFKGGAEGWRAQQLLSQGAGGERPAAAHARGSPGRAATSRSYLVEDAWRRERAAASATSGAGHQKASPSRAGTDPSGHMSHAKGQDRSSSRLYGNTNAAHDLYNQLLAQHRPARHATPSKAPDARSGSGPRPERAGPHGRSRHPGQLLDTMGARLDPEQVRMEDASDCDTVSVASEASTLTSSRDVASSGAAGHAAVGLAGPALPKAAVSHVNLADLAAGSAGGKPAPTRASDQNVENPRCVRACACKQRANAPLRAAFLPCG